MTMSHGRSPLRGSGCQPSASTASADAAAFSRSGIPNARRITKRPKGWSKLAWKNYKYRNNFRVRGQRLFMVICEGGGLPTVVHTDRAKAAKEAYRLAHFNRGMRFHVLASVDAFEKPPAQGIEAPSGAETVQQGSVHESQVGDSRCARHTPSQHNGA